MTCKDCIHYEVCYHIEHYGRHMETEEPCGMFKNKSDYAEVKRGEWILHPDGSGTCNQCGRTQKAVWDFDNAQQYCGKCGAKMDGGKAE